MSNSNTRFTRTLEDLNNLVDSEIIKNKKFDDFLVADLKKMIVSKKRSFS